MASPVFKALLQRKIRMAVESFKREHRAAYGSQVDEIAIRDTDDGVAVRVGASAEKPVRKKSTKKKED